MFLKKVINKKFLYTFIFIFLFNDYLKWVNEIFVISARLKSYLFYLIYGLFTDAVKRIISLRINNKGNILIIKVKAIKGRKEKV